MTSGRKNRVKAERKAASARKPSRKSLVATRLFAPLLGVWGAALGGLVIWVLPEGLVSDVTKGTLIATFDLPTQLTIAAAIAVVLGTLLFMASAAKSIDARRSQASKSIIGAVSRHVRPIDPVHDLGTNSLDDPIETMPFATPAWRDAEAQQPEPAPVFQREAAPAPAPAPAPTPAPAPAPQVEPVAEPEVAPAFGEQSFPLELDLSQFAALPGRNAVWVEEPVAPAAAATPVAAPVAPAAPAPEPVAAPAPAPEPVSPVAELRRAAPPPPQPGTAALARLRALPTRELSLVEMVERFAGALHEHRTNMPSRALTNDEIAARGTALAEALKALAALSGDFANRIPAEDQSSEPLRAALLQLQPRREVA